VASLRWHDAVTDILKVFDALYAELNGSASVHDALVMFCLSCILTLYSSKAIIVPHRIIWSWHTWIGCYIWYSQERAGRGRSRPRLLLVVPNVIAHPWTASVPTTVFMYNRPLLCGFNVPIKGLNRLEDCWLQVRLGWLKLQDRTMTDKLAWPDFAGQDNDGKTSRAWHCRTN